MTIHIAAGSIGLIAGTVALFARKGRTVHRQGGMVFVIAMLAMSASAIPLAVWAQKTTSVMGGCLTFYLVLTSFLTIRRPHERFDWVVIGAALAGISLAVVFYSLGMEGLRSSTGTINGLMPEAMFVFGSVALIAALGDVRVTLVRAVSRPYRIARHLWRMCFALLMAAVSFFLGQAQVLPELLRNSPVPALIPVVVVILMFYWILRVQWSPSAPK
ncbi:MAG: hypothetical protein KKC01_03910 [Gammaproteobacteria bacterium]|nr:hypothetical protein [Gammaproteobacteria bacterium]